MLTGEHTFLLEHGSYFIIYVHLYRGVLYECVIHIRKQKEKIIK